MLCITNNSIKHQSLVYTQLNDQAVLVQTIKYSISHLFTLSLNVKQFSIWPIDRTLSGATTPRQSGPGSDGNEGVLCIPQSYCITRALPADCLMSYPGHPLLGGVLSLYRDAVGVFYSPSRLAETANKTHGLMTHVSWYAIK